MELLSEHRLLRPFLKANVGVRVVVRYIALPGHVAEAVHLFVA